MATPFGRCSPLGLAAQPASQNRLTRKGNMVEIQAYGGNDGKLSIPSLILPFYYTPYNKGEKKTGLGVGCR
jgi:hypothetical protein